MPQSPKELERVTEEADVDAERAELEDTGPQEKASASRSSKPLPDTPNSTEYSTTMSSANTSTYQKVERHSATRYPQVGAVPTCPVPPKSRPTYPPPIDPPPRTPPAQTPSTDQDSNPVALKPRRKVNSSAYSILCEEEESIFPTRKWTKPLSGMGDASKWKIGVLRKFSAIEY